MGQNESSKRTEMNQNQWTECAKIIQNQQN